MANFVPCWALKQLQQHLKNIYRKTHFGTALLGKERKQTKYWPSCGGKNPNTNHPNLKCWWFNQALCLLACFKGRKISLLTGESKLAFSTYSFFRSKGSYSTLKCVALHSVCTSSQLLHVATPQLFQICGYGASQAVQWVKHMLPGGPGKSLWVLNVVKSLQMLQAGLWYTSVRHQHAVSEANFFFEEKWQNSSPYMVLKRKGSIIWFSSNWEEAGSDENMILFLSRALLEAVALHLTDISLKLWAWDPNQPTGGSQQTYAVVQAFCEIV